VLTFEQALLAKARGAMLGREIRELALSVWENPADAEEVLSTPHALLEGERPLEPARTPEGAERVRKILLALEYGPPV
jgi:uncharacterized protein (DUF2384 family)